MHVLGISMILLIPSAVSPQVSYSSHMIGFAVGLAAGLVYYLRFKERLLAREERVPYDDEDSLPARTEIIKEVLPGEDEDGEGGDDREDPWIM